MFALLRIVAALVALALITSGPTRSQPAALLLDAKIPIGSVLGRIDHMAFDAGRQRLFVAELGNNSVGVVDVNDHKLLHRIAGLREPQGVGYVPMTDTLSVASGGDGSLRLFKGDGYADAGRLALGSDADNVRVDAAANQVVVGYGDGGLAIVDASSRSKIADIPLKAHPEAFQLGENDGRIFVNVPNAHEIAVVDRGTRKQIGSWPIRGVAANFPMALDQDGHRVLVMFRNPARLGVFGMADGASVANVEACGDADDLFVDAKRHRIYVSCGAGAIDVFDARGYDHLGRIPTAPGARTSLFAPDVDRLFLAVRATAREPAALWVFRPAP